MTKAGRERTHRAVPAMATTSARVETNGASATGEASQVSATVMEGSWWPCWQAWLADHSEKPIAPPSSGAAASGYAPLAAAPGQYVLES